MVLTNEPAFDPSTPPLPGCNDVLARESRLLVELAQLADDRAAAEVRVEAQYQAASKSAERAFQDSRAALATELEIERRDAASDYAEQRQPCPGASRAANGGRRARPGRLAGRRGRGIRQGATQAERKLKETRWEAETLFEASKDIAPRQLKEFEQLVESWQVRVRQEHEDAQNLLVQWRLPWSNAALRWRRHRGGQWLARLAGARQLRDRRAASSWRRCALPPLAASFVPMWPFGIGGHRVGRGGTGPRLGLHRGPVVLLRVGFRAAGWRPACYLRRLAQRQADEIYPRLDQATLEAEALAQAALDDARTRAAAQQAELVAQREFGPGSSRRRLYRPDAAYH